MIVLCRPAIVIVSLLLVNGAPGGAAAQTPPPEPVIVVTGEGVVKSAPDRAWVTIGAENRSRQPKEAQAQNAVAMTAVQEKLAALGLPKDAIRTVGYDLQLEFDWTNGKQVPRGYVARNSIEVRVDDIARVGEVMDAAVGTGATSIHGLRFDLKQRDAIERDALRLAVVDARARAEAVAAGAGAAVGRIVRIEESSARVVPPPQSMMMARMAVDEARQTTPVAAGEIEIRGQVTLTVGVK
ncbi:MAG: SIMPL domain-containing protein [Vicinamibacterales bacterium]